MHYTQLLFTLQYGGCSTQTKFELYYVRTHICLLSHIPDTPSCAQEDKDAHTCRHTNVPERDAAVI